jgi:cytochrome c oxidase cbb3-type subunit I/II
MVPDEAETIATNHPFMKGRGTSFIGFALILVFAGSLLIRAESPADTAEAPARMFTAPDRDLFRQGRFVYQKNCQACHGRFGEGNGELVRDWEVQPRNFQKAQFKYRSTPYGKLPTDEDLKRTIRHGVSGSAMPVFEQLQDSEIQAVIEYIKFFSPLWKDEKNYAVPIELPGRPDWFADPSELKTQAAYGKILFRETCAPCHGAEGAGDGVAAAGLQNIEGVPIRPADLRPPLHSGPEPEDVYRTIMTGITGTPMMGFSGAIKPGEAWQIVAHSSQLKTASKPPELDVDQGR